jgi:hypothetical protein
MKYDTHYAGMVTGIRHDQHLCDVALTTEMLHEMHVVHMLRPPTLETPPFLVLGDSAYADSLYIKKTLGGSSPPAALLSAWRTAVEHQFNMIYTWFPQLKNKRKNKLFARRALLQTFTCASLYCNMRACLRDNQVATYFGLHAPTLADFMSFAPYARA